MNNNRITNPNNKEVREYKSRTTDSASFLTDSSGAETQQLVYLPFGEDWVDMKYNNPQFQTPYKFNGKEKDQETGYNNYGARYYYDWASIFLSVDPMSEELPDVSTYAYCLNNPIKLIDPDGEFPVWAIVGAVVDYGFQVHDNYKKGSSGYDAWIGDVDFVDVGLSAVNPTGKFKIAKTLVVEASKAAIDYTKNDGVKVDTDVKKVAKKAAVNTVVEVGAQKLTNAGSKKAMQNANKEANVANKRLKSLEVQAQRSPNSTKKAGNVNTAQSNAQAARNKQVRTKMLNSTVGKAPEATQHVIKTAVNRTQKDE